MCLPEDYGVGGHLFSCASVSVHVNVESSESFGVGVGCGIRCVMSLFNIYMMDGYMREMHAGEENALEA